MRSVSDFADRFNLFLYQQHIRKLGPSEREVAKTWCMDMIRKEHPELTQEQMERFYENLVTVKWNAVDEWTQRMT